MEDLFEGMILSDIQIKKKDRSLLQEVDRQILKFSKIGRMYNEVWEPLL